MRVLKYPSSIRKKTLDFFFPKCQNIEHNEFGKGVSLSSQGDRDGR